MFLKLGTNEYGTPVSEHICNTCGDRFTVCPPVDESTYGGDCLAESCESYDESRDADKLFEEDPGRIRRE